MRYAMDWIAPQGKEEFDKLFTMALHEGLQKVRVNNEAVIVMSEDEFKKLTGAKKEYSFKEHLLNIPSLEGVDLERDKDMGRDVEF